MARFNITLPEKVVSAMKIKRNTREYQIGNIITLSSLDGCATPIFGKLTTLLKVQGNWFICCKVLWTQCFNEHYHAYEVTESQFMHIVTLKQVLNMQCLDGYEVGAAIMVALQHEISN